MEGNLSSAEYRQRAEMHDSLANATADAEARKMHRAMAEAYRLKAKQQDVGLEEYPVGRGPVLEVRIPVGARG
jgi:hypothetical protein